MRIGAIITALKNFLKDLDEGYDKSFERHSKDEHTSLEELEVLIDRLEKAGYKLKEEMEESWPLKDDLSSFISELDIVHSFMREELNIT